MVQIAWIFSDNSGNRIDAETYEQGGLLDFALREYSPRYATWLAPDPARQYPSPYVAFGGNPAHYRDPSGGMSAPRTYTNELIEQIANTSASLQARQGQWMAGISNWRSGMLGNFLSYNEAFMNSMLGEVAGLIASISRRSGGGGGTTTTSTTTGGGRGGVISDYRLQKP